MPDEARELCLRLWPETQERIREDRGRASVPVAKLLEVLEQDLLDPDLDVNALLRRTGQRNRNLSTRFASELGLAPKAYLLEKRMELAGRILVASTFQIWRVGVQVGYLSIGSFNRAFKEWSGRSPSAFRKSAKSGSQSVPQPALIEMASREELTQAIGGQLSPARAETLAEQLFDLGDQIRASYPSLDSPETNDLAVEIAMARNLWQLIRSQPFEAQVRAVESQAPAYRTQMLFLRLCAASLEAKDEIRALERAHLVVQSVRSLTARLAKEEALNVCARAWTVAGVAYQSADHLDDAAQSFHTATQILLEAGDYAHPVIVAEVCCCQALLEMVRGNLKAAAKLLEEGREILRLLQHRQQLKIPAEGSS